MQTCLVVTVGVVCAIGIKWVEVKDADQPHAKNQVSPNVNIAEIWKCLSVANLTHGQHLFISFAFYFNGLKIIRNCSGLGQEEMVPFLLIYPSYK